MHALDIRLPVPFAVVYVARSESQNRGMVNDRILIYAIQALVGSENLYVSCLI